jgi:hypothetical protein
MPTSAAVTAAREALDTVYVLKDLPYSILRQLGPLEPLLVERDKNGYYIVPFAYLDSTISLGAIIVNAYSGQFQEAAVFPKPIQFLTEDEAIRAALCYVGRCSYPAEKVSAQLIFKLSDASQTRFLPLWRLTIGSEVVYVSQEGRVYRDLPEPVPGS